MRTTITLEPDVAVRLQHLARERGLSFKTAVNATLRAGLDAAPAAGQPYQEVTHSLGVRPGIDLTKALLLAAQLEDEEVIRELELRK